MRRKILEIILPRLSSYFFWSFILVFCILIVRSPDRIVSPELWAEDGIVFLKNAFEENSLLTPHLGYFQFIQRSVSEIVVSLNLIGQLPFIFNLFSIVLASLTISIFATKIYAKIIPQKHLRLFLCIIIAAGGAHHEIIGNLTNTQWYLGLFSIHLLTWLWYFKNNETSSKGTLTICLVLILSVLSSPQLLIFSPIALLFLLNSRISKSNKLLIFTFLLATCLQILSLLSYEHPSTNPSSIPLSASFLVDVAHVIFTKVISQNLLPVNIMKVLSNGYILILSGLTLLLLIWLAKKFIYKHLFYILSLIYLALSSIIIVIFTRRDVFTNLSGLLKEDISNENSGRYFFLSFVIFILLSISLLSHISVKKSKSYFLIILILLQVFSSLLFFQNRIALVDTQWQKQVKKVERLRPGETVLLKTNPDGWTFKLTRRE